MSSKNSFLLYNDNKELFEALTNEQAGILIKAIFAYSVGEEIEVLDPVVKIALIPIKSALSRDSEKYKKTCENRAENGKKGGRPKKEDVEDKAKKANGFSEKQTKAKKADSDSDSDSDSDIDIDSELDSELDIETDKDTNTKKKTNKKDLVGVLDELANSLNYGEELKECLKDFAQMRKEIKYPLSETSLKATVKKLESWGYTENEKIECLNNSIANSWRGVFELNKPKGEKSYFDHLKDCVGEDGKQGW